MKPIDIIIILALAAIALGIILYIRKEKKKGSKCVGCPYGNSCSGNCSEKK